MKKLTKGIKLYQGDCLDVLSTFKENHFDSVVTDPPYHLVSITKRIGNGKSAPIQQGKDGRYARLAGGFMGQKWDGGDIAFSVDFWKLVLHVMKPGAHLVAFGASRGYHRMACAIEDAGFEIRDSLMWLYGTGFPKSHNLDEEWGGWGTALKPAFEPIVLARKSLSEKTVAANVLRWRTGALNIDACRIVAAADDPNHRVSTGGYDDAKGGMFGVGTTKRPENLNASGRWPANVCHDGSAEVIEAFPSSKGSAATYQRGTKAEGEWLHVKEAGTTQLGYNDGGGSAARFFYSAKASRADRADSKHPTVKPIALMEWLCKLITPPGGKILDPFAGSGTTGYAALKNKFRCVMIEREEQYGKDIQKRFEIPPKKRCGGFFQGRC